MSRIVNIDRYPGLRPFEESERFMFFGRSMELEELAQAVNINDLFVIHGESGLGKSSLINAGLIPVLREKGFYPVLIRFKERSKPPLQQVLQELKKLLKDIGNGEALKEENKLWVWVKLMNSVKLKPILIFDQFEEFSYFNAEDRIVLVKELAALLSPRIPDYARDITPGPEADPTFSWFTQPKVKLLFSLRSDRISILEDFSELMPAMLRSRYQLKPILLEQVEQIVVMPAVMESFNSIHFNSSPFQYQPALINDVIDVVKDKKRNTVETTQLQMICQEIESMVKHRQEGGEKNICVTQNDLPKEKLEDFVNDFYRKQLEKIHNNPEISPDEFIAIRVLIEKRLLVQKKRIPLAEGTVVQHFTDFFKEKNVPISEDKIKLFRDLLLSLRLIRDQTYGDSLFYELSHDTLIEPINTEMTERETGERRKLILEERRKQELEILKQKKYIDEINAQKDIAESALKELEVAVSEQKKQTEIAQKALAELQEVKKKEAKTRRRLSRIVFGIVVAVFALIISYVIFLDSRNKKSNNMLARLYMNEGRNHYELGNHQLAFRFWKDALEKSSNETLNKQIREELKRDFAAFSGKYIEVSEDGTNVSVRLEDSTWYFWELQEKQAKLLKTYRHTELVNFFEKGPWYYIFDKERVRVFSFSEVKPRRLKNAYIDFDTASVNYCQGFYDFILVWPKYGSAAVFSFKRGANLTKINSFIRKLHDSSTIIKKSYLFPVVDSTFMLCNFNKRSYYLDLIADAVYPLPFPVEVGEFDRFRNLLAVWPENKLQLMDLRTRIITPVPTRFLPNKKGIAGIADNGRFVILYDRPGYYPAVERVYGFDLDKDDKPFKLAEQYASTDIFFKSPYVPVLVNNRLQLFDCIGRKVVKRIDSVDGLTTLDVEKVLYWVNRKLTIADRSTLATDTVMGEGFYKGVQWPLLLWEKSDSSFVYDFNSKQILTAQRRPHAGLITNIKGRRFLLSEVRESGSYSLTYYLNFIDSSMRVNENLQRYFKNYLDDEMDINK